MAARGTPKFDLLIVSEIRAEYKSGTGSMLTASAYYASSVTGETHGWTRAQGGWSAETLNKLAELREAMENDIASRDFDGGSASSLSKPEAGLSLGGIGEHIGTDAPQA
jgi:hypothetical protein